MIHDLSTSIDSTMNKAHSKSGDRTILNRTVTINEIEMAILEHRGQRVVTLSTIDRLHIRPEGTARRNFNVNRERLIEGEDFEKMSADVFRSRFPDQLSERATEDVTLLTESGYLMLVKSFTDDLAWDVQRKLIKSYFGAKPQSKTEILLGSLQSIIEIEQQQRTLMDSVARMGARVEQIAESQVWDHCPQNSEPITKIRNRIGKRYGLPARIIDTVMRGLPLSPKIHGMVKHAREQALGAHYEVWAIADVTRVFNRFFSECTQPTPAFATHPDIDGHFKLIGTSTSPTTGAAA